MGQKVHPTGLRIGIIYGWQSRWFVGDNASEYIGEDLKIRKLLKERLVGAGVSRIEIERAASSVKINIFSAKPGLVIGKKGQGSETLEDEMKRILKRNVTLKIIEVRKADSDAMLVAQNIAFQLEKRVGFRKAMKDAISRALRSGAEGVKVKVGGRLNGAEIARSEQTREGRVPLHTLRADVDYGTAEATTTYGLLGVKVWVFKGERFSSQDESAAAEAQQQ